MDICNEAAASNVPGATALAPQEPRPMPPMAEQPLQPEYDVTVGHGGGYGYGFAEAMGHSPVPGTEDLVAVWAMPSTATIGPQEPPRTLEKVRFTALTASLIPSSPLGEKESVQIALRPRCAWGPSDGGQGGEVEIHVSDFHSSSGECLRIGEHVTLRRVLPMCGVPDALVPMQVPTSCLHLPHGETAALWLSLAVPSGLSPGVYEGEVVVEPVVDDTGSEPMEVNGRADSLRDGLCEIVDELGQRLATGEDASDRQELHSVERRLRTLLRQSEPVHTPKSEPVNTLKPLTNGHAHPPPDGPRSSQSIRLPISIVVWDFVLPTTPSLPAVMGVSDSLSRGTDDWCAALDAHFQWLLPFRVSPYFCRWEREMQVYTYTCPWPVDHPRAEAYYSDPRLSAYALPYAGMDARGYPVEGKEALLKLLGALKDRPHFKKAYFYLWDEPTTSVQHARIREMAAEIHAAAPGARVLTTYYSGARDGAVGPQTIDSLLSVPEMLRPHCQVHCVSQWALAGREDAAEAMGAKVRAEEGEWWSYVCMGPGDPQPNLHLGMRGTQQRAVLWRVWKEGGTGFLYWGTNCYDKARAPSAEIRFRPGLPFGDGVLFYPGQAFSPENTEPVASCRLERFLSGMQDYEYLTLYARMYGRPAAQSLLANSGVYLNPGVWTPEHGPVDNLRDEIARACSTLLA
ncbi:hypothetical protein KFL_000030050 [Klebsormidium nitens]|uniref:Glycoside hydrolase 123 catalytic domain-containing protein n=1 Tax=Klebsormidium nitens TaxID=105231 RepID=A0A1Y1HH20_KLENI|nr:hypothetical protein KFL_000030050 [Klebsormidium nitens]|eukprot:GAQ77724.1 hypothetical protein KFL_000030050 [Klebsormidium nitens]